MNRILQRLLELDAVLTELAVPNFRAVKKALALGSAGRPEWEARFREVRKVVKKPPEKVTSVAVRLPSGHTEYGPFSRGHISVLNRLKKTEVPGVKSVTLRPNDPSFGFRTNRQPFVSRKEGLQIVRKRKVRLAPGNYSEGLHSGDMRKPQ